MELNRDKQIEERRDISDIIYWSGYGFDRGTCNDISKQIQEQGYRKASEVAREIFGMLREDLKGEVDMEYLERLLTIYEKKYTEGEG